MALLSRIRGMIHSRFSGGSEKAPAATAPVLRSAVQPGVPHQARTGGTSDAARRNQLQRQYQQALQAVASARNNSATGMAAQRLAPIAVKKDTFGAWHLSLEKELSSLLQQENSLRFAALEGLGEPGDKAKLAAITSKRAGNIILLSEAIKIAEEKIEPYKNQQATGQPLTRAQQSELAELDEAVLALRLTRLKQPLEKK